jgi:23S rRNA (guanosine2251-2'-O)-methyltransferase
VSPAPARRSGRDHSRQRDHPPAAPRGRRRDFAPRGGERSGGGGRGLGGEQVEGRRAVRELLAAGRRPVHGVWMAEDLDPSPILDDIERLAARRHAPVHMVSRRRIDAETRTDAPQGVLARAGALPVADLDELCRTRRGKIPLLAVLDGVTDPHNLGSLLRSAECAGVTGVVLPRHRAVHVTPTVAKVAAGAIEHLPMAVVPGIPNALHRMAELGVATVGLDASTERSLYALAEDGGIDVHGPVAVVVGAERKGLAPLTRRRCDVVVTIPQHGTIESLNVAAAGAVAFFELARVRRDDTGR